MEKCATCHRQSRPTTRSCATWAAMQKTEERERRNSLDGASLLKIEERLLAWGACKHTYIQSVQSCTRVEMMMMMMVCKNTNLVRREITSVTSPLASSDGIFGCDYTYGKCARCRTTDTLACTALKLLHARSHMLESPK